MALALVFIRHNANRTWQVLSCKWAFYVYCLRFTTLVTVFESKLYIWDNNNADVNVVNSL